MFRRIELLHDFEPWGEDKVKGNTRTYFKNGLMGVDKPGVSEAWIYHLRGPKRGVPWNTRFYFTEKGWKEVGRNVITACQKAGQEYRVIAIKETDAQVVWRDKHTGYEVAIQPKRKR